MKCKSCYILRNKLTNQEQINKKLKKEIKLLSKEHKIFASELRIWKRKHKTLRKSFSELFKAKK